MKSDQLVLITKACRLTVKADIFMFPVWWQHLVAVVVITAAKEDFS